MPIHNDQIILVLAGASFAAGLNVYATLATLGLLARSGALNLPPTLHLVESWPVIVIAIVMFVIEFFADKIPAFDLIWNALHTFIRVPIAALLAYGATAQMSPATQAIATILGGSIAFAAHGGKTAVRAAVTPSPEPVSNIALSMGEDVVAVGLTWFATKHPYLGAAVAVVLLVITILMIRWIVRVSGAFIAACSRRMPKRHWIPKLLARLNAGRSDLLTGARDPCHCNREAKILVCALVASPQQHSQRVLQTLQSRPNSAVILAQVLTDFQARA